MPSQVPLEGRFGDNIALVGYDLDRTSFDPGEWLDLTLYWHVLDAPLEHYVLAIQLVSAIPGDTATLINFNTWTGGGNYPTGSWRPGDVIADRYELQIPEDVPQAQGWTLQTVLFGLYDHERLPFTLDDTPAGDAAHLALLRVGATDPEEQAPPEANRLATPFVFGGAVALDGVRVTWGAEEVDVVFWWRSVAPLEDDAVVFVHLYDAEGQPLATADGPPLFGGFVTSLWQPGDRVRDERIIVASREAAGPLQLGVGWYDLVSGARLVAMSGEDERLPHDEVLIPVPP